MKGGKFRDKPSDVTFLRMTLLHGESYLSYQVSYPVGTRGSFPGVKRPGRESDHSHLAPSSRMRGAIPPLPHYASMAWCSVKTQETSQDSQSRTMNRTRDLPITKQEC
jgi:hypothetical protein